MKIRNYINTFKQKKGKSFDDRNCLNDEYIIKKLRKEKEIAKKI